jgi:hypothetical protein
MRDYIAEVLRDARADGHPVADRALIALADERARAHEALAPIGAAYPDDPGTAYLYDEQPVTITLGDVRRVWRALRGQP